MDVATYALFPTRLVAIQFPETGGLDRGLCDVVRDRPEFADGFNMHPDALNLLQLAGSVPAIARLRGMFLEGLRRWLAAEGVSGPDEVDLVLFCNDAAPGEMTLVHNHNADLVGIYYARTAAREGPALLDSPAEDYFDSGDGLLVLHDPRFNANLVAVGHGDHVKVGPRPGLMLVFPAYLWHSVTPHRGEFRRLSFSMNFTLRWPGGSVAERLTLAE